MQSQHTREKLARWRYRRPGPATVEERLAGMLALLWERAETAGDAFFNRLQTILEPEEYSRLLDAWSAREEPPAEITAKVDADEEARALWQDTAHLIHSLHAAEENSIISEHYVYRETGRVRLPKEWGI